MGTICAGWRQVFVQMDGLYKAEADDHDRREYGDPSLQLDLPIWGANLILSLYVLYPI